MCADGEKDTAREALNAARRYAEEGKYEQALEKHVWFHDHALKIRPSYCGVRLSFALLDWVRLGRKFPADLGKLKEVRNAKTLNLRKGEKDKELLSDVASINSHLDTQDATVALFKYIDGTTLPLLLQSMGLLIMQLSLRRSMASQKKYLGDPMKRITLARSVYDAGMRSAGTSRDNEWSNKAFEAIFTNDIVMIITVLDNTGDSETARKIQFKALSILASPEIEKTLID